MIRSSQKGQGHGHIFLETCLSGIFNPKLFLKLCSVHDKYQMQLQVCNHPDLFEGRPIVSSFDMPALILQLPSEAMQALRPDQDKHLDLGALALLLINWESMSGWKPALLWYGISAFCLESSARVAGPCSSRTGSLSAVEMCLTKLCVINSPRTVQCVLTPCHIVMPCSSSAQQTRPVSNIQRVYRHFVCYCIAYGWHCSASTTNKRYHQHN